MYVLVVIEHGSRRIPVLGATTHPTATWVAQAAKNLVMDLEDLGFRARFMIRDSNGKFPSLFDAVLKDEFYNGHRPHQGIANARPLQTLPSPIDDPDTLARLNIRRRDRLGGILHEYRHTA